MEYAEFVPLPTPSEELKEQIKIKDNIKRKNDLITNMKLVEIKSDYLAIATYYYQKLMNTIFVFHGDSPFLMKVVGEEDEHLRKLNNLPAAHDVDM